MNLSRFRDALSPSAAGERPRNESEDGDEREPVFTTRTVAGSLRRLGDGEKRVTQKLEIARRHKSDATSQSSDWSVSFPVTWPFLLVIPVSCLCLAGACLAGGGPAWRPACCARGLDGRGLAGGWLAGDLPAAARLGPGRRHTAHSTHSQNSHSPSPRTR